MLILIIATLIGMRLGTTDIRRTLRYLETVPTGDLCYHEVPTRKDYIIATLLGGSIGFVVAGVFTILIF